MSRPARDRQQPHSEIERENQRLREEIAALRQQLVERTRSSLNSSKSTSEKFLRLAIDSVPQSIFWKDRDSVFLGCNESLAQLAGLNSPDEIVGKTDYDLPWMTEEAEFFRECDRQIMESGIPELGIVESQQQSDGSQHWLETNKLPVHDEEGNVIGILGNFVDVTQRQKEQIELQRQNDTLAAEFAASTQKLQATESRLRHLADNLPGVIFQFCIEPDGTQSFPYVSDKSREIYEVEPHDFLQAFTLVHPDDAERLQLTIQESAQTLQQFDFEHRIITPSGILKWVQVISQPIQDDSGDIIWDGIIIDVSARKNVEQALNESEAKYKQILDAITDMVLVKGEHSRIVWANKAFREYYGMGNKELQKLIDAPFSNPDYTQQYIRDDAHVFNTGETLEVEEPVIRHDGITRKFSTIKSAIRDKQGQVFLTVGVSRDVRACHQIGVEAKCGGG